MVASSDVSWYCHTLFICHLVKHSAMLWWCC